MKRKRRAQSTLEYTLLFAGLTVAILYGVSQVVRPRAQAQMDTSGNIMTESTSRLATATGVEAAAIGGDSE